nr:hypothetical protein [Tanacetum cinerariifolium]
MKIHPHQFNAESDLIESLLNRDSLSISSFSKIDSLFDEFSGELTLLKSIPPGINETDCDPEGEIRLIKSLLYDNSSPRPPEEFISENSDNYPMPPGIEEDDYDSERDILIFEELLSNDSLSLPENESFHFDIPSSFRPPAKPPDGPILRFRMSWASRVKYALCIQMMTYPPLRLEGLLFELEWDPIPNYTIRSSNSFELRKIIFEMITSVGIRHAKAYTLHGSEDYDEEREMEPRPEPNWEATLTFWPRSPVVRRQRERVVGFNKAPNMEGSRRGRNAEGIRSSEIKAENVGI